MGEKMKKQIVGIPGRAGSFSYTAVEQLFGLQGASILECDSLPVLFDRFTAGEADFAVVPITNTLAGIVPGSLELIEQHKKCFAVAETYVLVRHTLLAAPGVKFEDIHEVLSHPVALAQCTEFFRKNPQIRGVQAFDTAGAVEIVVADKSGTKAAIGSKRTVEIYGAQVLRDGLQDDERNWTRFLLLSNKAETGSFQAQTKVSVCFKLKHAAGELIRALQPFNECGINLWQLTSRPVRYSPEEVWFFLECFVEQNEQENLESALESFYSRARSVRILGRYLAANLPYE